MTYGNTPYLLALVNMVLCAAIIWSCFCRLNTDEARVRKRVRLRYVLLLTGAGAHGAQPILFGTMPGVAGVLFSVGVLIHLMLGMDGWRSALNAPTENHS